MANKVRGIRCVKILNKKKSKSQQELEFGFFYLKFIRLPY